MAVIGNNVYVVWSDSTGSVSPDSDILFKRNVQIVEQTLVATKI